MEDIQLGQPKSIVLDTNVILHDAQSFRNFEHHNVIIPIAVLEELDKLKLGNEVKNFQAREFIRQIDGITANGLSSAGVSIGKGKGLLKIVVDDHNPKVQAALSLDTPDNRILSTALNIKPSRLVVLVSNDVNLRMKAKSFGLQTQDYSINDIYDIDELYTGKRTLEHVDAELVNQFYEEHSVESVEGVEDPVANESFILKNGSKSVLAYFSPNDSRYHRVDKENPYGIKPRNAEQSFAIRALLDNEIKLVTIAGKAGTGKTLLALASALSCSSEYRQIMLARPVVPLSNKDLGFLPGDISAKMDPYMQPLFDNLSVIRHQFKDADKEAQKITRMLEQEKLVISPLAYIRGRSLQRMYMIVDEAQNLTPHEVKTIITRAGEGTKIILTGDIFQIDHPYLDSLSNGLSYIIDKMKGQSLYAHITLEKGERSQLADIASELL